MMDEFITDDQLSDAIGLELKEYHKIVDWMRLKKYNNTGIIKVIKNNYAIITQEVLDSIYSQDFNNISPKVVWAWNIDVVEEVAQKILDYKQLYPTIFSCE